MDNSTFIFNGIKSTDMGLHIIRIDSGFYESPFISGQDIIEDSIPKKHKSYLYGVHKKPLQFDITFSLLDEEFTPERRYELARWLIHEDYKEFQTTDYMGKLFYVIATNQADFMSGGTNKGYFTLSFRTDAPWAWSPVYIQNYDLSTITIPTIITLENRSNVTNDYYPELEITAIDSNITLKNLSDNGREFKFTGLQNNEKVYANNERKQIISSLTHTYRLSNFNKNWLRLKYGINQIEVTGKCRITTKMQYPILI